ncbi:5922_t:CDS:1, partial [Funneliformis geosporum]
SGRIETENLIQMLYNKIKQGLTENTEKMVFNNPLSDDDNIFKALE